MRKIYGNTVGMGLPKPDLSQTDPNKGNFVYNKDKLKDTFIGDANTTVAEYYEAYSAGKVCFMRRFGAGGADRTWILDYSTQAVAYFYHINSGTGWVEYGKLSSDGTWADEIAENGEADLTGYATEEWVQKGYQPKGNYLTEHQSLEGYAKTDDIPTKPGDIGAQPAGNYALKSEIPNVPVQSVNGKTGAVQLSASDVGALPSTYTPPNQTAAQVGADPAGTAAGAVAGHNTNTDSHADLRLELKALTDRLNAFFDSDNQTLDELSEIVAYITSNKALIDSVTTSKVSVADIINNLTTNVANKPLSAAQGVALKALIDAITVPTQLSQLADDSTHRVVTDTEKAAWNAKSNFSGKYEDLSGKPTIPTVPTKVSAFENDAGYLTQKDKTIYYIEGTGDTAGTWLGSHPDIKEYTPGLTVLYKVPVAGASPTTLNINNLGAVTVVRNATTSVSTNYPVNSIVTLTYTVDSGTAYFKQADYDANTKTSAGTGSKTGTKLYLAGATSQSSSGVTTYSNANCYIGTNNRLYSGGEVVPNTADINALIDAKIAAFPDASEVEY